MLTQTEKDELVTVCDWFKMLKHSTSLPCTFTEHGSIMLANVLRSPCAIQASIAVVRAFIRLREILITQKDFAEKLAELERRLGTHDHAIRSLFDSIRQLMMPAPVKNKKIGFL